MNSSRHSSSGGCDTLAGLGVGGLAPLIGIAQLGMMKLKKLWLLLLAVALAGNTAWGEGVQWKGVETVCFLPLDTRPCAYDLPIEIEELCGARVLYPPKDILADFHERPNLPAIQAWVERAANETAVLSAESCAALVISAEQLVYGGLVQSREAKGGTEEVDRALELLRKIKKKRPEVPIYLSNTLMRTSISALDEESVMWWRKVNEYSSAYYRAKASTHAGTGGDEAAKAELERLTREIPEKVLSTFLHARALCHALNLGCIQLVKEGVVEQLLLYQEDSSEEGIQRLEQEELARAAAGAAGRIFMANGTSEAGCELMARALRPEGGAAEVLWLGENTGFSAMYEDRPFVENLKTHMAALRIRPTPGAENVICILPPKRGQRDHCMGLSDGYQPYSDAELEDMARRIFDLTQQGRHVFLLDLDSANGGTPALLTAIARRMSILELYGYSAWDTANDSLGTLLAQLLACDGKNGAENRRTTAEHILNDCVYQSVVRQQVSAVLRAEGVNVWDIEDTGRAMRLIDDAFVENRPLLKSIFGGSVPPFEAALRWPRLFEIAIRVHRL